MMSILAVVLHGVLLLADPWLRPGLAGILIPFASPYRPLAVALGIVGFYVTLLDRPRPTTCASASAGTSAGGRCTRSRPRPTAWSPCT